MSEKNEKELVLNICNRLLSGSIKEYHEVQSIWQENKIKHEFLIEIMDSTSEFIVLSDSSNSKEAFEGSYEYLCIYLAVKVLNKYEDLSEAQKEYSQLIKKKDLTKQKIDVEV